MKIVSGLVVTGIGMVALLALRHRHRPRAPEPIHEPSAVTTRPSQLNPSPPMHPSPASSSSTVEQSTEQETVASVPKTQDVAVSLSDLQIKWRALRRELILNSNPNISGAPPLQSIFNKIVEFAKLASQVKRTESDNPWEDNKFDRIRWGLHENFLKGILPLIGSMSAANLNSVMKPLLLMYGGFRDQPKSLCETLWIAVANRAIEMAHNGDIGNHALGITKGIVLAKLKTNHLCGNPGWGPSTDDALASSVDAAIALLAPRITSELERMIGQTSSSDFSDNLKVVFATFPRETADDTWLNYRKAIISNIKYRATRMGVTDCIEIAELIQTLEEEAQEHWKELLPILLDRLCNAMPKKNSEETSSIAGFIKTFEWEKVLWLEEYKEKILRTLALRTLENLGTTSFWSACLIADVLVVGTRDKLRNEALRALGSRIGDLASKKKSTPESFYITYRCWSDRWNNSFRKWNASDDLKEQLFVTYATQIMSSTEQMNPLQLMNAIDNLAEMKSNGLMGKHSQLMNYAIHNLVMRLYQSGKLWTMPIQDFDRLAHPMYQKDNYYTTTGYLLGIRLMNRLIDSNIEHPFVKTLLSSSYIFLNNLNSTHTHVRLVARLARSLARSDFSSTSNATPAPEARKLLLLCANKWPNTFTRNMSGVDLVRAAQMAQDFTPPLYTAGQRATKLLADQLIKKAASIPKELFSIVILIFAKSTLDQTDKMQVINALATEAKELVVKLSPQCAEDIANVLVRVTTSDSPTQRPLIEPSEEIRAALISLAAKSPIGRINLRRFSPGKIPNITTRL